MPPFLFWHHTQSGSRSVAPDTAIRQEGQVDHLHASENDGTSKSANVQVFGRRHDERFHGLWRPASKKRQGTKSREVCEQRVPRALWGFCRGFRLVEAGLKRLPQSACREAWSLASV